MLGIIPFFALPEPGDALAVHFGEETAESRGILIAQQVSDLLGAFRGIEQQAARLGIDPVVDDVQRRGLPARGEEVGERLGRPVEQPGIVLHPFLRPKCSSTST